MAARLRGKLCRAIARDPIEGLGPEGGARPYLFDKPRAGSETWEQVGQVKAAAGLSCRRKVGVPLAPGSVV